MSVELRKLNPPILAGFGNPLLDICVILRDDSFYKTYGLEMDCQKEVTASELQNILDYFKKEKYEFKYCAGGSAQNSLRIFQSLIKQPNYSVFFGGIGNDEQGSLLEKEVENAGVCARYTKQKNYSTGTCIAIINGVDRCLVAHLGAADVYSVPDFYNSINMNFFDTLYVAYIEGFFITHSFETALEVIKLSKINGVAIAFNMSAVYLCNNYYKETLEIIKLADIVIGNSNEYREFWRQYNGKSASLKDILKEVQSSVATDKVDKCKKKIKLSVFENSTDKIVVSTQGSDSVLCVYGKKESLEVMPRMIDKSLIKDTTGAGDSFAAGLLAGILQNKNMREIIEFGCRTAEQVIQHVGCTLSD
ncbi:adenosine kinase-like [Lycorma delicatula]|uniref:adenosine kinase-like n=1 Tax=Lycorma delicatula TaxID=130591 RepID=UPI003F51874A